MPGGACIRVALTPWQTDRMVAVGIQVSMPSVRAVHPCGIPALIPRRANTCGSMFQCPRCGRCASVGVASPGVPAAEPRLVSNALGAGAWPWSVSSERFLARSATELVSMPSVRAMWLCCGHVERVRHQWSASSFNAIRAGGVDVCCDRVPDKSGWPVSMPSVRAHRAVASTEGL